jgi:hypothetical protein
MRALAADGGDGGDRVSDPTALPETTEIESGPKRTLVADYILKQREYADGQAELTKQKRAAQRGRSQLATLEADSSQEARWTSSNGLIQSRDRSPQRGIP